MKLTATITQKRATLTATLDPIIIAKAKLNLYELAQAHGFTGSFDDFMASLKADNVQSLISTDTGNALNLGADQKLYVNPLTKQDW